MRYEYQHKMRSSNIAAIVGLKAIFRVGLAMLVMLGWLGASVAPALAQSAAFFGSDDSVIFPSLMFSSAAWGDYDNDGDLDLALAGYDGSSFVTRVYQKTGGIAAETFALLAGTPFIGTAYGSVTWVDFDNDGDLDLMATGKSVSVDQKPIVSLYRNDGSGSFTEVYAGAFTGVSDSAVAWGDYDNDGRIDVMIVGNSSTSGETPFSQLYRNTGSGFVKVHTGVFTHVLRGAVAWADYDNDGDLDLMLTGQTTTTAPFGVTATLYQNTGSGFVAVHTGTFTGVRWSSLAWGDYDFDGDVDLMLAGRRYDEASVAELYQNNGSGFTIVREVLGVSGGTVAWGDEDNDGDLDLMTMGWSSELEVRVARMYKNKGSGFEQIYASTFTTGLQYGMVAWGDYNGDGDLDLVLTGQRTNAGDRNTILYTKKNVGALPCTPNFTLNYQCQNEPPLLPNPTGLTATVSGNSVTLTWNPFTDENGGVSKGLSYNLRVGTSSGAENIVASNARADGRRKVAASGPILKNGSAYSWTLKGLAKGTYFWSVQAIDAQFAGSPWAAEGSFAIEVEPNSYLLWTK